MMVRVKVTFILFLFLVIPNLGLTEVRSGGQLVIVLDASSTMNESFGSTTKLEASKAALLKVVRDWDPSVALGITVAGHRKERDCADVHRLLPVGHVQKQRFEDAVQSIRARGVAAIADAVVRAAKDQWFTEEKATVIVLTDGRDRCHREPCRLAEEIERQGQDLTVHVVEFVDIHVQPRMQLRCLATATGGRFESVDSPEALSEKLMTLVALSLRPIGTTFRVRLAEGTDPLTVSARWKILKKSDQKFRQLIGKFSDSLTLELEPGEYKIQVVAGSVKAEKDLEVGVTPPEAVDIVLNAGRLTLFALQHEGAVPLDNVRFRVFEEKGGSGDVQRELDSTYGRKPTFILAEGRYLVEAEVGANIVQRHVRVIAGAEIEVPIVLGMGQLRMRAVGNRGNKPLEGARFKVYRIGGLDGLTATHVATKYGREPVVTLPQGRYRVTVTLGALSATRELEIFPGQANLEEFVLKE